MSGGESRTRLALLDELAQIVGAMKNLAYVELQRLSHLLVAQREAEQAIQHALQDLWPNPAQNIGSQPGLWLAVGSERGFCGGFNDQMADRVLQQQAQSPHTIWLIAGERLHQRLEGHLPQAVWLPGSNGSEDYLDCVEHWSEALAERLFTLADGPLLWVLHQEESGIQQRQLLPLPTQPASRRQPRTDLSTAQLQPPLLLELVRVQLLGVQFRSLQQENVARLAQMKRAQDHLDETRQELRQKYFRQRQADITGELETLMSSLDRLTPDTQQHQSKLTKPHSVYPNK